MQVFDVEWKQMETKEVEGGFCGHITLDRLAIPETVKVTLQGETLIPISFDFYGHPNFTAEQEKLCMFKEEELRRESGNKYATLEAEIVYVERTFDVPRSTFDEIQGIKSSLASLSDLNEMIQNRKLFRKAHPNDRLNEFVLFDCFLLDQFGQVEYVEKMEKERQEASNDVEYYSTFKKNNWNGFVINYGNGYIIPMAGSRCPCCGKTFTMEDIKTNPCVRVDGKIYHDSCWRNYRRLTEIDKFTRQLMSRIYEDADYQFELLPNGYCNESCCSHIPWFLFHTIDGDIIMGWRKRVISIEWQENYKPFDMKELFGEEDVTQWEEDGNRGIHAWGKEKAYEYLQKVAETVNPSYFE